MIPQIFSSISLFSDMALLLLFTAFCWLITDGFRRNRLLLVPLSLGALYLRFGVLGSPMMW